MQRFEAQQRDDGPRCCAQLGRVDVSHRRWGLAPAAGGGSDELQSAPPRLVRERLDNNPC
jgi:hypothetical protein